MYNNFFGFCERPFNVTPDPRIFYSNPIYQQAYTNLRAAICERQNVIVLTGEAGTGKTTLLRRLMKDLEHSVHFAFCPYTMLSLEDLLDFICDDLGLPPKSIGQSHQLGTLKEFLLTQQQQARYYALLIDEAHNLQLPELAAVAQLSNFMVGAGVQLPIALVGQPELEDNLHHPTIVPLKQIVALTCQLDRLQSSEVGPFIFHRLRAVGYDRQDLFPPEVVTAIAKYAQGIPRYINTICDNALLITYTEARKTVTRDVIEEVAQDLLLLPPSYSEGEEDSLSSQSEPFASETQSIQQSVAVSTPVNTLSHTTAKSPSLYPPTFFPPPRRRQLVTGTEFTALSFLLFLLLALQYFPTPPRHETQVGPPSESPAIDTTPSPTISPPQSESALPHPQSEPQPPQQLTNQQVAQNLPKPEPSQITIASVHTLPPVSDPELKKQVAASRRDPFTVKPQIQTDKGAVTLLSAGKEARDPQLQLQDKKENGKPLSPNQPPLRTRSTNGPPQEVKTTSKAQGSTPLILAVMRGDTATVEKLLKDGANVNEQNVAGRTPLMFAALAGRLPILKTLLSNGANINATNVEGWTALMYAAWNGDTKIVQMLMRNGANLDTKNATGGTALSQALRNGHHKTAHILRTGKTKVSVKKPADKPMGEKMSLFRNAQSAALLQPPEPR